ncbi:MAG: 30S ribosomal protein S1 [Candidatus Omnitrophota bacterium]
METSQELKDLYSMSFKEVKEGQIVKGKIVSIGKNEVFIDVGYKSEGIIPIIEFSKEELEIDREIEVLVEATENEEGMIVLSYEKAKKLKGWQTIVDCQKNDEMVDGKVIRKVKGGYMVDVWGVVGFLPASLSTFKNMSDRETINKVFKFKITKMNNLRKSLILSRKEAQAREVKAAKGELWSKLEAGQVVKGKVKAITDFGAFIDLGGVDGLLHITDMSWSKVNHPSEVVAIDDQIELTILSIDKDNEKVSLGLKQRLPDPWENIENKYPSGSKTKGKVVNILPYGIFVELEKGIEGLVHISEISWSKKITNLSDTFAIGDIIEVQVLNIDRDSRRISLSIKQLEVNPWLEAEERFPVNSRVTGVVRGFTDYGAFIELEGNLEGMIHVSDLSWTKRIARPQDILKKGQKIEAMVISVDGKNRKISLGLKQLLANPWPQISEAYPVGKIIEVTVVSITEFGVFAKLEEDIEGLIYSNEIDKEALQNLKVGDKLEAKIIKVDIEEAKIGLSAKI